jgi:hypothetical protein
MVLLPRRREHDHSQPLPVMEVAANIAKLPMWFANRRACHRPFSWYRSRRKALGDDVSGHKFKVGQTVHYTSEPYGSGWCGGVFNIMLLPPQGGDYQYRIKSADEPYDRVVKEGELDRAM